MLAVVVEQLYVLKRRCSTCLFWSFHWWEERKRSSLPCEWFIFCWGLNCWCAHKSVHLYRKQFFSSLTMKAMNNALFSQVRYGTIVCKTRFEMQKKKRKYFKNFCCVHICVFLTFGQFVQSWKSTAQIGTWQNRVPILILASNVKLVLKQVQYTNKSAFLCDVMIDVIASGKKREIFQGKLWKLWKMVH